MPGLGYEDDEVEEGMIGGGSTGGGGGGDADLVSPMRELTSKDLLGSLLLLLPLLLLLAPWEL